MDPSNFLGGLFNWSNLIPLPGPKLDYDPFHYSFEIIDNHIKVQVNGEVTGVMVLPRRIRPVLEHRFFPFRLRFGW